MHSKAMVKWTIELFLCMLVIVAGIIIILVALPIFFTQKLCPQAQAEDIMGIKNKVDELKGKPGYEIVYFEVKNECVEKITPSGTILNVKYTTVENPVPYDTDAEWINTDPLYPNTYTLRVFADRVEVMRGENQ